MSGWVGRRVERTTTFGRYLPQCSTASQQPPQEHLSPSTGPHAHRPMQRLSPSTGPPTLLAICPGASASLGGTSNMTSSIARSQS